MLINATFFHVAPLLWTRGRCSPVFAAFVLFYLLVGMNVLEEVVPPLVFRTQSIYWR
jgi:hypothetical protein